MVKRTRTTLSNGLPLVVIEVPGSKSAVVSFWTKAGTRLNPKGKEGLAHFLEHVLLKKTRRYPTDQKLAEILERVGAWKNGLTHRDYINFSISAPAKALDIGVGVLSEMIFGPLIDKKGVNKEREVIRKEQIRKDSSPEDLVWDVWHKVFFKGSSLEYSSLGTATSIYKVKEGDLRNFWERYFKTKNSLLVVSGGVDIKEVKTIAEKYFGEEKLKVSYKIPVYKYKNQERVKIEKKELPQATMLMSFRFNHTREDFYPLIILRGILFAGWSGRIPQRLRVKEGLIYSWEGILQRYVDTSAFNIILSTDKRKFGNMVSILSEELNKLKRGELDLKDLVRLKGYIEGSLITSVETSEDYHNWYAKNELFWPEDVESVEERIENIKKVTSKEVFEVANKYLTKDNWQMAVVGDVKEKDFSVEL